MVRFGGGWRLMVGFCQRVVLWFVETTRFLPGRDFILFTLSAIARYPDMISAPMASMSAFVAPVPDTKPRCARCSCCNCDSRSSMARPTSRQSLRMACGSVGGAGAPYGLLCWLWESTNGFGSPLAMGCISMFCPGPVRPSCQTHSFLSPSWIVAVRLRLYGF